MIRLTFLDRVSMERKKGVYNLYENTDLLDRKKSDSFIKEKYEEKIPAHSLKIMEQNRLDLLSTNDNMSFVEKQDTRDSKSATTNFLGNLKRQHSLYNFTNEENENDDNLKFDSIYSLSLEEIRSICDEKDDLDVNSDVNPPFALLY